MNYIILLEQLEPMNVLHVDSKAMIGVQNKSQESQTLSELIKALKANRQTQQKLKATRDSIRGRMMNLQEFISTFRLNQQYPPANATLSYIKFQRHLSVSFREQQRIAEPPPENRTKHDEDAEFMIKLHQKKAEKRRQMLNIEDLSSDPKYINFVDICKGTQFKCGLDVYKAIVDSKKKKEAKRLFQLEEDQKIESLHRMYGDNWEKINQMLDNRQVEEIYYEFHNRINPHLATGRWTIRQTLMLIILLQHFGPKKWATIAQKMVIKSELQVRQRYCNLIDPSIGKDVWTLEMERRLLQVAEEYDFCWKRISLLSIFNSKTDNCIWRKYKLLMIRFTEEEIREMLPNEKKYRGLAEKIMKEKRIVEGRKRSAKNKPQPPIYYNHFRPKNMLLSAQVKVSSQINSSQGQSQGEIPSQSQMSVMVEMDEEYFHDYSMELGNG